MAARFRVLAFWLHLTVGVAVSVVVLLMALTGSLLSGERSVVAWFEADTRVTPPAPAERLPPSRLLERLAPQLPPDTPIQGLLVMAAPDAPSVITSGDRAWLVDPYRGELLRESGVRQLFAITENLHRTLASTYVGRRDIGTSLAGAAACAMLLLVPSGLILWWPRTRSRGQLRRILWFSRTPNAALRDWTWHHVVGFWCAPVLLLASVTGALIAFDPLRAQVLRGLGDGKPATEQHAPMDLDASWAEAMRRTPDWTRLRAAFPHRKGKLWVRAQVDEGVRPTHFRTLQVGLAKPDAPDAAVELTWTTYEDGGTGTKLLGWGRWLHTGQALGPLGSWLWGIAALGAAVLAVTGVAMAWRRWRRARHRAARTAPQSAPKKSPAA